MTNDNLAALCVCVCVFIKLHARRPSGLVGKLHICYNSTEVVSSILTKVEFVFFLS